MRSVLTLCLKELTLLTYICYPCSHRRRSIKIGVLKKFWKTHRKTFFIKKILWHRNCPVTFTKILRASFFTKLFSFWSYSNFYFNFFREVGKRLDNKAMVDFKIYDVTGWETNNWNSHIAYYLKKKCSQTIKSIFLENTYTKRAGETSPRPISKKSKLGISLD